MTAHTHAPSTALDDAIAAYALDALDAAERPGLEAQLASCAACREQLADLQRAVTGIGVSLAGEEPPALLRNKVLNDARASRAAISPAPPRGRSAWPWLGAAAAAVVLIAASAWFIKMARPAPVIEDARAAVINAPDVVKLDLLAQPDTPGSSARIFMSPKRGMVLLAEHLPALAAGKTYQLWVVTKQAPVSVGVFAVKADGSAAGVMPLTAEATLNPVAVAITIEPEGGVPSPTGPKVLVGVLAPQ